MTEAQREAERERCRRYYRANREAIIARVRAREAAFTEAQRRAERERLRKFARTHRPSESHRARLHREANRAKYLADRRRIRAADPEKAREADRRWREANPEKALATKHRRRAREYGAFVEDVSRHAVLERDAGICGICGLAVGPDWHLDHIIPLARGGEHSYANVQVAHPRCNKTKGGRE